MGPPDGVSINAWRVLALTVLMAVWWVTEALPIAITALLPVALLPLLDVRPIEEAAASYANPLIFLFLGGFILAEGIQRWNLHRRLALLVLSAAGTSPQQVVGGFMLATAGLSMWVSNTATAALMLPIGLSVLKLVDAGDSDHPHQNFSLCLLLGIAMSANIGGMATLIGTPPNAILAGYLQDNHGIVIGFGRWMIVAFPLALTLLALGWWLLTRRIYPITRAPLQGLQKLIEDERQSMGAMTGPEKSVTVIFVSTALAWLTRPMIEQLVPGLELTDAGIAIIAALALFVIPASWHKLQFLMDWETAQGLPWGVLLLVGGGLSLGSAIESSGLAAVVADALFSLAGLPLWLIMTGITTAIMLLSHVSSNTATTATMLPLVASLALGLGIPLPYLTVPVAMAASCAFMLPVATPPNAIIFSSNRVTVAQMARAGALMSLITIIVITLWVWLVVGPWLTG
jgi:sodium-dependent dicarboxylate transporter 2/3/5